MITRHKVALGRIYADAVTKQQALDAIVSIIKQQQGGYVVTPNVDHVCLADNNHQLVTAYKDASLSLVDGMPLVWLSHAIKQPLPEKISGADLLLPLLARAADEGLSVYCLGGAQGIAEKAMARVLRHYPTLRIAGYDAPPLGFEHDAQAISCVIQHIQAAKPHILLVALGCPKQELWMQAHVKDYAPAVAFGIGASLDFLAGSVRRAPAWMSRMGLEWLFRLWQEPQRLAKRYLVRDRAFLRIALQQIKITR